MTGQPGSAHSSGVSITAGGDVYIGGDVVGRDKITLVDAAVINWLALGTNRALSWFRLMGIAVLLGLCVAVLSQSLLGAAGAPDSVAISVLYGAIGAVLGGLVAWYSPSLPAAMLRVAWVEGGLVAAQWLYARLAPTVEMTVPAWFGLPLLHASLLVSFVGGPWLALVTYALIRLVGPGRERALNRRWRPEALAIVSGCAATGILIAAVGSSAIDGLQPPIDPSIPPQRVTQQPAPGYYSGYSSGDLYQNVYTRFETHRDGFIVLPGWLSLSQAVAILLSLGMIVPVSAALSLRPIAGRWRRARPLLAAIIGGVASVAVGVGLDVAANAIHPVSAPLSSLESFYAAPSMIALLWGLLGALSGVTASGVHQVAERLLPKPSPQLNP